MFSLNSIILFYSFIVLLMVKSSIKYLAQEHFSFVLIT